MSTTTGTTPTTAPAPEQTLAALRRGDTCTVVAIDDERARDVALRFGMAAGASVQCVTALPAGPIVLRSGRQEIAVGRGLARRIRVRRHTGHTDQGAA